MQNYATDAEIALYNQRQQFPIHRLKDSPWFAVKLASRLAKLLNIIWAFRPEIVLVSGTQSVWLYGIASFLVNCPWVIAAHGGIEFEGKNPARRRISKIAYSRANAIVCVSTYTRSQVQQAGIRGPSLTVITNGADDLSLRPMSQEQAQAWKKRCGFENAFILLTVGSVTERKGQEVVIRALPKICQEVGDVHYLMAGLPVMQENLTELASSLGVADRVHFLGKVDEDTLLHAYNACDVFLMTSQHSADGDSEGFGIAVIEAALCGKPAVVSAQSGLAEAVINRVTGLHVAEGSPAETARAVIQLLADPAVRKQMGQAAWERALREQTWTKRAGEYEQVLLDVITRKEKQTRAR